MLRNLKGIYREIDKPERMLDVLNRMLLVTPDSSAELRDRGIVYQRLECYRAALKDLTDYAEREPDAPDLDEVRGRMMELIGALRPAELGTRIAASQITRG